MNLYQAILLEPSPYLKNLELIWIKMIFLIFKRKALIILLIKETKCYTIMMRRLTFPIKIF